MKDKKPEEQFEPAKQIPWSLIIPWVFAAFMLSNLLIALALN